jgi:hypothetical protein
MDEGKTTFWQYCNSKKQPSQQANYVFAGPASGLPAAPSFRALVPADIPGGGGGGTVTSVAMAVPTYLSVSGSPITGAGTFNVTWTSTPTSTGTASTILALDASSNTKINNLLQGGTTIVTSGITHNILATQSTLLICTGSTGDTWQLPDATTVPLYWSFTFNNNATSAQSITNNGGGAITTALVNSYVTIVCTDNSTTNGVWDYHGSLPSSASAHYVLAAPTGSTGQITPRLLQASDLPSIPLTTGVTGILPVANGGTNAATAVANTIFAGPSSAGPSAPGFRTLVASDIPSISLSTGVTGTLPIANGGTGATSTTQNYVFVGPTSGSGAPSFRALVAGDIPAISLTAGVSGTLPVANGGTGVTTSTGSGSTVLSTSPTLVTPTLGVATATSVSAGYFSTVASTSIGSILSYSASNGYSLAAGLQTIVWATAFQSQGQGTGFTYSNSTGRFTNGSGGTRVIHMSAFLQVNSGVNCEMSLIYYDGTTAYTFSRSFAPSTTLMVSASASIAVANNGYVYVTYYNGGGGAVTANASGLTPNANIVLLQ